MDQLETYMHKLHFLNLLDMQQICGTMTSGRAMFSMELAQYKILTREEQEKDSRKVHKFYGPTKRRGRCKKFWLIWAPVIGED